jgi:ABC-type nickel/cobalt efflux system permease component RcnA
MARRWRVALGALHGAEPGHGWPVAATYALDRTNHVLYGLLASLVIGVGHLVSSLAMVAAFFYAKSFFELEQVNDPITLFGTVDIGGPVSVVAGVLLIALGIREARHGHSHSHGHGGVDDGGDEDDHAHALGHDHENHRDHSHGHGHDDADAGTGGGIRARLRRLLPGSGGHSHANAPDALQGGADRGLVGIAWFAFLLGFAHEEEFEIIALCAGSVHCLELMVAYALTVILAIVGLTMLLVAGYRRAEARVERYAPYLPLFSAAVLVGMGVGFVAGVL